MMRFSFLLLLCLGTVSLGVLSNVCEAAELEDALAIMWLACCYHRGCAGFGQDLQHSHRLAVQAVQEVERLAYIGDAQALFLLGDAYQAGLAVKQNPQQALSWYRKAAEQGHLIAQRTLGVMYVKGRGVLRNEAEAANWFRALYDVK